MLPLEQPHPIGSIAKQYGLSNVLAPCLLPFVKLREWRVLGRFNSYPNVWRRLPRDRLLFRFIAGKRSAVTGPKAAFDRSCLIGWLVAGNRRSLDKKKPISSGMGIYTVRVSRMSD